MYGDWSNSARVRGIRREKFALLVAILVSATFCTVTPRAAGENGPPHASADHSGEIAAGPVNAFILAADLGSVQIQTLPPNANPVVRYSVHLETDARQPMAQALLDKYSLTARQTRNGILLSGTLPSTRFGPTRNAQFWVQFVVTVPANFSVEVTTGAGDIETSDIGGRAVLLTGGGNIRTGKVGFLLAQMADTTNRRGRSDIGGTMHEHRARRDASVSVADPEPPVAKLETTNGGHITLLDIAGDVDAYTAGGHIQAGNIAGNAILRTGGGHIRAGRIKGTARLETVGGNIAVGEAGSLVSVRTGGGQIDFGEVHGSVKAETGGGGIRVIYVAGPMEVETSGGSICLTRVVNTVRAATGTGTITAWIAPDSRDTKEWVNLPGPSQLASSSGDIVVFLPRNLAATIDAMVETGSAASIEADPSLAMSFQPPQLGQIHAMGTLNGGGSTLRLRTGTGKIRLKYIDEEMSLRQSLLDEQRQRLATKLGEAIELSGAMGANADNMHEAMPPEAKADWFEQMRDRLEIAILGGLREDPEEFKKRLINSPPPEYPQVAQRAGLQGVVRLQVRLKTDGTLVVEKVLEGEPALVDGATAALKQWRANPELYAGRKVDVITTVTFNFQLR